MSRIRSILNLTEIDERRSSLWAGTRPAPTISAIWRECFSKIPNRAKLFSQSSAVFSFLRTQMKKFSVLRAAVLLFSLSFVFSCGGGGGGSSSGGENQANSVSPTTTVSARAAEEQNPVTTDPNPRQENDAAPRKPNTQAEILDERNATTAAPIGKFDFRNYIYPLPRGWQDPDGKEAVLHDGERRMAEKQIGLSYVAAKYGDANGDGTDEAFVILKIVTAGSAIPQIVYVFEWQDDKPELIWFFRTGDRADGGLKNIYADAGELVVELFGQDRYILGGVETLKITGDEEQLCCPTYFTRTRYKQNGPGGEFRLQGKRLTYSVADPSAPPIENMAEILEKQQGGKK
jgi:hypothetical protein